MNSLPLAVRAKDDGDLIWFSDEGRGVAKAVQAGSVKHAKHFRPEMFVHTYVQLEGSYEKKAWIIGPDDFRNRLFSTSCDPFRIAKQSHALPLIAWSEGDEIMRAGARPSEATQDSKYLLALVDKHLRQVSEFVPSWYRAERKVEDSFAALGQPQPSGGAFVVSEQFVQTLLSCQADGERREVAGADRSELQREVSERVVDAIADIGYRWMERRRGADKIVSFDSSGRVEWCDEELAKLLVYELNVSIVAASRVFDLVFGEVYRWVLSSRISGDWGRLVGDGAFLTLVPTQE
jgi:hypothetical protein